MRRLSSIHVDGKDKIVGADIDLVNEIAKQLGVKAEVSDMSFNTVLASLKGRKIGYRYLSDFCYKRTSGTI